MAATATPTLDLARETQYGPEASTLYLKIRTDPHVDPSTAVFFPAARTPSADLDVVLYLHGSNDAKTIYDYLNKSNDPGKGYPLRERFNQVKSDVVLVAPSLSNWPVARDLIAPVRGPVPDFAPVKADPSHPIPVAHGLDQYLDLVCAGIREYAPEQLGGATGPGDDAPAPVVRNLYLAAHSAGGPILTNLIKVAGSSLQKVRACWLFDSLYQISSPEPVQFWKTFCQHNPLVQLRVYYRSTAERSLKLQEQLRRTLPIEKFKSPYLQAAVVVSDVVHHMIPWRYFPECLANAPWN